MSTHDNNATNAKTLFAAKIVVDQKITTHVKEHCKSTLCIITNRGNPENIQTRHKLCMTI